VDQSTFAVEFTGFLGALQAVTTLSCDSISSVCFNRGDGVVYLHAKFAYENALKEVEKQRQEVQRLQQKVEKMIGNRSNQLNNVKRK
jgi:hypothetical protein